MSYLNNLLMNDEHSNKFLLIKFRTLMALRSAGRGHEIADSNVKYMYRGENSFIFHISKVKLEKS